MIRFFSVCVLAILVALTIIDFRFFKTKTSGFSVRQVANLGLLFLVLEELLLSPQFFLHDLILDFAVCSAILLSHPCSFEKPIFSLFSSIYILAVSSAVLLICAFVPQIYDDCEYNRVILTISSFFVSGFVYCLCYRLKCTSSMLLVLKKSSVWFNIEKYSRSMFAIVYVNICFLFLCSLTTEGVLREALLITSLAFFVLFYVVLYVKCMKGRSFVVKATTEDKIKIISENCRLTSLHQKDKETEQVRMDNLYKRILDLMGQRHPFLDSDYSMEALSAELYTNKLYISKTINASSGKNFRQFLNSYRIEYAIALMKKDPRLRVSEISDMSGFHSVVSFNMAFKINMDKTPSEWMRDYLSQKAFE